MFCPVLSVVAPNYALIVAHLKLVVMPRLAWDINSVASDKHSNAILLWDPGRLTVRDDKGFGSDRPPRTLRDRTLQPFLKLALLSLN